MVYMLKKILFFGAFFIHLNAQANLCFDYLESKNVHESPFLIPQSDYRRIEFIDSKIDPNHFVINKETEPVYKHLSKMLSMLQYSTDVNTVFYPAVGSDTTTAFRLFKDADVVVGMGSDPFITDGRVSVSYLSKPKVTTGWDTVGNTLELDPQLKNTGDLVEIVITDLKNHFPDLIIVDIVEARSHKSGNLGVHSISGVIQFMEYPGGPLKTYVHLHVPKLTEVVAVVLNDPTFSYLKDYVFEYGFQAAIAKASMGQFFYSNPQMFLRNAYTSKGVVQQLSYETERALKTFPELSIEYLQQDRIGFLAIDYLKKNGGVLVDGDRVNDKKNVGAFEDTLNSTHYVFTLRYESIPGFKMEALRDGKKFGYNNDYIDIIVFEPLRRN